jgi:uncharacterized protein YqjF (DUF2071 family)
MSATNRPNFLRAQWRYLLMLSWHVSPELLMPLVPGGTELDFFEGRTFVSVVGFRFLGTRVLGIPAPFHRNFDEVNLRFYVRRIEGDGAIRRGVAFIREVVPRRAIAWTARLVYNEPYVACGMRSTVPSGPSESPGSVRYGWCAAGEWEEIAARAAGEAKQPALDSLTAFIAEHYWGYTRQRDGRTIEYAVEHPRWRVWDAAGSRVSRGVGAFYGSPFDAVLSATPCSAFIAEGSEVSVRRPTMLAETRIASAEKTGFPVA